MEIYSNFSSDQLLSGMSSKAVSVKKKYLVLCRLAIPKMSTIEKSPEDKFYLVTGFGAHFNCPVIALSTFSTSKWTNDLTRVPMEYSYVAHNFIKLSESMNFYERTLNTLSSQYENIFMEMVHYERQVSQTIKAYHVPAVKLF
jgi:hypothetical protein